MEDSPDAVQAALLSAVESVVGPLSVLETQTHRWRYAMPTHVLPTKFVYDAARRIGGCGDWCDGPRVEGALESGWHLARAVLL